MAKLTYIVLLWITLFHSQQLIAFESNQIDPLQIEPLINMLQEFKDSGCERTDLLTPISQNISRITK